MCKVDTSRYKRRTFPQECDDIHAMNVNLMDLLSHYTAESVIDNLNLNCEALRHGVTKKTLSSYLSEKLMKIAIGIGT